mgnify:CR=1 FL=1
MKGLDPERGSEVGLYEKGADDVICGSNEMFRFAVLGRGVWARKQIGYAVDREEGSEGGVNELPAIVTLHAFDDYMELGVNEGEEALQNRGCVRFVTQGEGPRVVSVVIQYNEIILKTRKAYNRRCPYIKMQ